MQELLAQKQATEGAAATAAKSDEEPPAWLIHFLRAQHQMQQDQLQAQQKLQQDQLQATLDAQQKQQEAQQARMDLLDANMKAIMDQLVDNQRKAKEERAAGPKPVPPPKLTADVSVAKFKTWRATWDDYSKLSKMGDMQEETQRALLFQNLSQDMRRVLDHAVVLDPATDKTPEAILDKIEEHVRKRRNVTPGPCQLRRKEAEARGVS